MGIFILNGVNKNSEYYEKIKMLLTKEFKENEFINKIINIDESNIANCLGCFGCWVRTPGECILKDDGNLIAKEVMNSSKVIIITETTFGGYSSITKKAIDRLIPNVSPLFTTINKETHYKKRYEKYPDMSIIAISDDTEDNNNRFENIVTKRNAVNFNSKNTKVKFISPKSISLEKDLCIFLKEEL